MTGTPTIPFNALGRAVQVQRDALDAAIGDVLDSGWFVMGPQHDGFERELAAYLGVDHCVAVANGTDALELGSAVGRLPPRRHRRGGRERRRLRHGRGAQARAPRPVRRRRRGDPPDGHHVAGGSARPARARRRPDAPVRAHGPGRAGPGALRRARRGARRGLRPGRGRAPRRPQRRVLRRRRDVQLLPDEEPRRARRRRRRRHPGRLAGSASCAGSGSTAGRSATSRTTPGGRNSRLDEMQAAVLRVRLPLLDAGNGRRRDIAQAYAKALGRHQGARRPPRADDVAHLVVAVRRRPGGLHGAARRGRRRLGRALPAPATTGSRWRWRPAATCRTCPRPTRRVPGWCRCRASPR